MLFLSLQSLVLSLYPRDKTDPSFYFGNISLDTEKAKKTHEQEVSAVLYFMKEICDHLRTMLVGKWKFREMCTSLSCFASYPFIAMRREPA